MGGLDQLLDSNEANLTTLIMALEMQASVAGNGPASMQINDMVSKAKALRDCISMARRTYLSRDSLTRMNAGVRTK